MDSMPFPVCKRVQARRCKKVRGKAFCGYCAAKKEKFFGWRLHLICTASGIPVSFDLLPASEQDLNPIHELNFALPEGATIFADKGYISEKDADSILAMTGVRLVATRCKMWRLCLGRMTMISVSAADALKPYIAKWRRRAFNIFMLAPTTALI